ncbi:MAG: hypothetical protein IKV55_06590 [Oscillospiraceae bacterium]|nr:hypothetical protein [Oscillospiraceae bacterium]
MYQINQTVVYSSQGICTVSEICAREVAGTVADYYVLKPAADPRSTVYVPVNNERLVSRMRAILSAEEAQELFALLPQLDSAWIANDNARREQHRAMLTEGAAADIAAVFKMLALRRSELETLSRKLRTLDENTLKQCEKLLCCECAHALGCSADEIRTRLYAAIL